MATNYSENLFDAVQILIDKSLESVKFDETINAIIVDASKAKNGQYTVSNGATDFVAYSTVTDYRKNDAVMVTIPQGNYDNQKIIIGKQVTKDNTPLVYKSPMENMVNLTNNLIPDNSNLKVEMWANSNDYAWEQNVKLSESKLYTTPIAEQSNVLKYCIWDSNNCNTEFFYQKYDVLGLSAQFSTWLNEYNTITGNYGLILEVTFKDLNTQENFVKIYSCQFDSNEFFGDIYNFETYYTQEKVFDLSDYKDSAIVRLRLFPYQRCNFTTIEGKDVPYPNEDDFSNIPPNIYMKDFMISLGSYSNEITEDTAKIMTDSSITYDKNPILDNIIDPEWIVHYIYSHPNELKDKIAKYWIFIPEIRRLNTQEEKERYKNEAIKISSQRAYDRYLKFITYYNSGEILKENSFNELRNILRKEIGNQEEIKDFLININNKKDRTVNNLKYINLRWVHIFENEIKVVQENEIPENHEIRWYRYTPGAPAPDQFAGVHWKYLAAAGEESSTLNKITVEFQPDVNKNEEKIKVIIVKKENNKEYKIATSNILEFNNNTEIRDTVTLKDAQALYLRPDDQFNGKYLIYNRNHKISQKAWYTQYTITAMFNPELDGLGSVLSAEDCSQIVWSLPKNNSMIIPDTSVINVTEDDNYYYYSSENNDKKLLITIPYFIKNVLNNTANNNTISLNIIKDGLEYFAAFNFIFGIAGTNGSDYTIKVIWNKNAIDVNPTEGKPDVLTGEMILVDKDGQSVDLSKAKVQVEWATVLDWDKKQRTGSENVFEQETEDLYFPVYFTDATLNSCQSIYNFIDGTSPRQPQYTNTTTRNYFFFKDTLNNNNYNDYYYYDLNSKKFIKWNKSNKTDSFYTTEEAFNNATEQDAFGPIYRKKRDNEEAQNAPKYKITFKEIKVIPGEETGEFYNTYKSGFSWSNGRISNSQYFKNTFKEENGKRVAAYYNYRRRYFVYKDGQYILDPWNGFNENEVYYEPILQPPTTRDDLSNSTSSLSCECIRIDDKKFGINITYGQNDIISLNSIYILKIIIKNFGDYNLISHEPIALKTGKRDNGEILTAQSTDETNDYNLVITNISCPTSVRYSTTGEVDIDYKDPFQISGMKVKDTTFSPITHFFEQTNGVTTTHILKGYWRLLIGEKINENFNPANKSNQFNPSLIETAQNKDDQGKSKVITQRIRNTNVNVNGVENSFNWLVYQSPLLKPPAIYYKDAAPYAIQFVIFDASNQKPDQVVWTQPICVFQDNYPSTTLNNWNGKDIVTDNDSGTIVANGFAAGHKNSDNTFSGVVLGDWSRTDIDPSVTNPPGSTYSEPMTGVYGFNHGAMSYALKDDGTAFFGKDGRGRIYFDGNNAIIKSASWRFDKPEGMMIDLDDGILQTRNSNYAVKLAPGNFEMEPLTKNGNTIKLNTNGDTLFEIKKGNKPLINIGSNYYLQSEDFSTIQDSESGTQINLTNGKITSYNLDLTGYNIKDNIKRVIQINSKGTYENDYPLRVGVTNNSNFLVKWDGTLVAKEADIEGKITAGEGSIAGWRINEDNLLKTSGNYQIKISSKTTDGNNIDGRGNVFEVKNGSNYPFAVKANGTLIASNAEIRGGSISIKDDNDNTLFDASPNGVTVNGSITATSGEIGGWKISSKTISKQDIESSTTNKYKVILNANPSSNFNSDWNYAFGIFSKDENNNDVREITLNYNGKLYARNADISGKITADSGTIGSWEISTGSEKSLEKRKTAGTIRLGGTDYGINVNDKTFTVDYSGNMIAKSGSFSGEITATSGTIGSWGISTSDEKYLEKEKTVSDSNSGFIRLGGTTYGINVNNKFKVDYSGNMTATSGTFSGKLEGASGTFKGDISAATGTFTGAISIKNGNNTLFSASSSGVTVNGSGSFSGTITSGNATITGGNITIKDSNNNVKFKASSSGVTVNGAITASSFAWNSGNYGPFTPKKMTYIKSLRIDDNGHITNVEYGYAYYVVTDPVYSSGGCFIAGTKILMVNGSYKNIEDIKENDLIISYDEINNKFVIDKVIKLLIHHNTSQLMTLILEDGTKIKSTLSHPFLTINGWKTIDLNMAFKEHSILCQKIKIGDILVGQNHNSKIIDILYENCPINYDTYNLFVKKYHTYIANNYIVHNAIVIVKEG